MVTKEFKYPHTIQLVKFQAKALMVLIPVLLVALLQSEFELPHEGYRVAVLTIVLAPILCAYIVGSFCEIRTNIDGLYVEFFWKNLFVPWEEIRDIKYIGFRPFGYWIVLTDRSLTIFHKLYSIGTFSFLPSFQIHENLESRDVLLSTIRSKLSKNRKNKN